MNTSKRVAALCALGLSSVAFSAAAGVGKGDFEAGASVSVTNTEVTTDTGAGDTTTKSDFGTIGGSFGYFVLDFLEIKGAVSMSVTDAGNYGIFSPGADFVFLGQKTVAPFAGLAYGLSFGDTVGPVDSDYLDVHGGIKFFVGERTSLEVKLTKYEPIDSDAFGGRTELAAGLNIYF